MLFMVEGLNPLNNYIVKAEVCIPIGSVTGSFHTSSLVSSVKNSPHKGRGEVCKKQERGFSLGKRKKWGEYLFPLSM